MIFNKKPYIAQEETTEIVVSLREDGIVHVFIKPGTHITVDVQKSMIETYYKVTNIKRPFIFEAGEFTSISKEARQNATVIEDTAPVAASAIIVKNLGQRIIADYYYKFNKPKQPLKIFKREEDAVIWLSDLFPN